MVNIFTPVEMLSQYRQCKNKKKQIKIFAQCNSCTEQEVVEALLAAGLRHQELPRQRKDPRGAKKGERRMKRPVEDKVLERLEPEEPTPEAVRQAKLQRWRDLCDRETSCPARDECLPIKTNAADAETLDRINGILEAAHSTQATPQPETPAEPAEPAPDPEPAQYSPEEAAERRELIETVFSVCESIPVCEHCPLSGMGCDSEGAIYTQKTGTLRQWAGLVKAAKWVVSELEKAKEEPAPAPQNDHVNHPSHYTQGGIECLDAIKASMSPEEYAGMLKGQIMKYVWRYRLKGQPAQDLRKAQFYLGRLIEEVEADAEE